MSHIVVVSLDGKPVRAYGPFTEKAAYSTRSRLRREHSLDRYVVTVLILRAEVD